MELVGGVSPELLITSHLVCVWFTAESFSGISYHNSQTFARCLELA
jgi:hypothetical protein